MSTEFGKSIMLVWNTGICQGFRLSSEYRTSMLGHSFPLRVFAMLFVDLLRLRGSILLLWSVCYPPLAEGSRSWDSQAVGAIKAADVDCVSNLIERFCRLTLFTLYDHGILCTVWTTYLARRHLHGHHVIRVSVASGIRAGSMIYL